MKIKLFPIFFLWLGLQFVAVAAQPQIIISPHLIQQGKCFSIMVVSAEGIAKLETDFAGQRVRLYKNGDGYKGIIGVPPEQKPGKYKLTLKITGNRDVQSRVSIVVALTKFPSVSFWLKPERKKLLAKDLVADEWALVEKVLVVESQEQRWAGKFLLPVKFPVSMKFGTVENVNNQQRGQHRGMDLAAPFGTEVAAANNGRVVFAQVLKVFGGTMVIDYGQGIHSLYFHLSKFLAPVGTDVKKGEVVALSGNSGVSSGPHLHWGMSVHNLRVDPMQWVMEEL